MITNEIPFMRNLRTALGKPADEMRMKNQFPHLFSSPDNAETLARIGNRSRREQLALIDILIENGKAINLQTHIAESSSQAADVIVDLIRCRSPEFSHTKH